jgi:hypothetical protein
MRLEVVARPLADGGALDARFRPRWPRFEFGSDEQISANLETLHAATPADAIAVGSVTRDPLVRAVQPRTPNAFDDLGDGPDGASMRRLTVNAATTCDARNDDRGLRTDG